MDPFHILSNTDYTFLKIKQDVTGNTIEQEYHATGVLKIRDAMVQIDNVEQYDGLEASLHVRPSETFIADLNAQLVGHGIKASKDGNTPLTYRINGMQEGRDFDTGLLSFYRLILKRESLSQWQPTDLPLE